MLPLIARHFICPLHERLLGRDTFRYVRKMEESQWFSPDDVRRLQKRKLMALLRHANATTRFYQQRFREAGVDLATLEQFAFSHTERHARQASSHIVNPRGLKPAARRAISGSAPDLFDVLVRLPLLSRSDIRTRVQEMLWQGAPGGVFPCNTGGSTGEPLAFYLDRRRQAYDQAARIRTHRWFGVNIGDRELFLWGSPHETGRTGTLRRLRDALWNQPLLSAFDMSPERMDRYLDMLERFRPACLFGYPSSIALLVEHARSRKRHLKMPELRAVFVTGEVCYAHHRETIRSYFSVPVADGYGSREAGFIAHQCPQGNFHLTAENVVVEIIKNDQPVPIGRTGEIVVTHLDAYAMPFIRYRTGDVGRLRAGRCACGRGLPMMDVVQGRTTDFLYLPDGTIKHALSVVYPLRTMRGVRQFRVTQHDDFSVAVDVVCDDRVERVTREAVARSVRPVIGDQVGLSVELVDRIPAVKSGKYRYVESHAGPAAQRPVSKGDADV